MRTIYIIIALGCTMTVWSHIYELIEPVDAVCAEPQYDEICNGLVYVWTKCDFLRAITTRDSDRQAFSWLILADVMHIANNMLKLYRDADALTEEQDQHLQYLAEHLEVAYNDAFADTENTSITCAQSILGTLKQTDTLAKKKM